MDSLVLETDVIALLRSAASELLPVVLEVGPERARFNTFVVAVEEQGGTHAVLAPIADALPSVVTQAFRIVSAADPAWFVVAHRIQTTERKQVRVDLARARAFQTVGATHSVLVPATELLVLVIPGGLHGSSAYIFPVQRVGAESCEIRSSVALEPGRTLPRVEIVGDRRLLRRASALVLETVPSYSPDGGRNFCCTLGLNEEDDDRRDQAHDLVIDPDEVRRLLEFAAIMRADGWYDAPGWSRGALRFLELGKDSARLELLSSPRDGDLASSVRIGIKLFAISYEFDVRPLTFVPGQLTTSLPLILKRRRRHRRDHRVPVDPRDRVVLDFRNPISGDRQTHSVSEVSFFGLSFECDASNTTFWRGLPLEDARLIWRDHRIELGDVVLEQAGEGSVSSPTHCSASIASARVADDLGLITLITTLAHPHVRLHAGDDFTALLETYLKAGLFGPHMVRNLEPILEDVKAAWRRMHRGASDLVRTFEHGPESAPDAAVTVLRAWEQAWLAQHLVDTSPELAGGSGRIQSAHLDYLVPRPDGRYLVFFIKASNRIMNAYVRRFIESVGTPEAVTRSSVQLWIRPAGANPTAERHPDIEVRPCRTEDEVLLSRAAQRLYGAASAGALSFLPGQFHIPDTCQRFERAGLVRARECAIVTRSGAPVFGVIEERSTPGMNLTWMLNACWIVPIHDEVDTDGRALDAALRHVVDKPAQSPIGERFLNLPEGFDASRLEAWGFSLEAPLYMYVFTRAGLHRYFYYTASRYGELGALASRRERRRAQQSGDDRG